MKVAEPERRDECGCDVEAGGYFCSLRSDNLIII